MVSKQMAVRQQMVQEMQLYWEETLRLPSSFQEYFLPITPFKTTLHPTLVYTAMQNPI